MILEELQILLHKIQSFHDSEREGYIKEFQEKVWNDETIEDDNINTILSEIAYDLDYYEPDEKKRKEFIGYYGNEKLLLETKSALDKLKDYFEQKR